MKKYAKVMLALVIALCFAGALTACGGDVDITGTWKVSSVTIKDKAYQVGDTAEGLKITADMLVLKFKSNKTFEMTLTEQSGQTQKSSGTWEKKGDTTYQLTAEGKTIDVAYKNAAVSLDAKSNGYMIYHLKKS